jgi:signal transduction histidine kinase
VTPLILLVVIAGAAVAGVALTWAALRVLGTLRRLSAEQEETSARLQSALRTRSAFIADASHELRTPLTVLRGNAELGLASPSARCGHDALFREIVDEAASMGRLVEDLLFLARSDAGSVPIRVQDVAIAPWLADVAQRAEILATKHGARSEALLIADGDGRFDPERVARAILALVDNAARYGPPESTVRLFARIQRWSLTVEVTDQGPGIAGSDLPLVFERFHRTDSTRRRPAGGVGLGLPIARTIVEAHGGRIRAWSRPGVGTSMTVELPLMTRTRRRADGRGLAARRLGADSRSAAMPARTSIR